MAFKLKSGNASSFKNLGSSPAKHKSDETHFHDKEGKVDYRGYDKADLFLRGKTKDKEGNIKDIKWAPAPKKLKYKKREPVLKKEKSPAKQNGDKEIKVKTDSSKLYGVDWKGYEPPVTEADKGYWYKINDKPATKTEYIKYQNKPGGDEPGKQTNDPTVSLAKQSADKRIKLNK